MVTIDDIRTSIQALHGRNWEIAIYQHYAGQTIYPDRNIISPLRDTDSSASLRIFKGQDGSFLAYDYGKAKTYNWLAFVHAYYENKQKQSIEFDIGQICNWINIDMGLGLNDDPFDIIIPTNQLQLSDRIFKPSEPPLMAVYPNDWSGVDKNYWGQYFINQEWLNFFDADAAYRTYMSYDKGFTWKEYHTYKQSDPMYYYHFVDSLGNEKFKILRPYAKIKDNIEYKWRTNIDKTDLCSIQGFAQADKSQRIAILTSSLKDCIILRMLGYTAYAMHGEGYIPTPEFINYLVETHDEVWLFMDSDIAGIEASAKIKKLHPIFTKEIFTPYEIAKDPSDFIKVTRGDFNSLHSLILNF